MVIQFGAPKEKKIEPKQPVLQGIFSLEGCPDLHPRIGDDDDGSLWLMSAASTCNSIEQGHPMFKPMSVCEVYVCTSRQHSTMQMDWVRGDLQVSHSKTLKK